MATSDTGNALLVLSNELTRAVDQVGSMVVAVKARRRVPSSGVLWRPKVVVTAAHTIQRDDDLTVILPDGRLVPTTLAGRDHSTDLAVLKLEDGVSSATEVDAGAPLQVGQVVLAVARLGCQGPSASFGILGELSGAWRTWRGGWIDQFIRPDLALYPGFSGGALVNACGRLIGINTSALSRHATVTIPAVTVNRILEELLAKGHTTRPYLGVAFHSVRLPEGLKSQLNVPGHGGLIVLSVEPNGPAERAGWLLGDILFALGDTPVSDVEEVQAALTPQSIHQPVSASLLRSGQRVELPITVGERPGQSCG